MAKPEINIRGGELHQCDVCTTGEVRSLEFEYVDHPGTILTAYVFGTSIVEAYMDAADCLEHRVIIVCDECLGKGSCGTCYRCENPVTPQTGVLTRLCNHCWSDNG